MKINKKLSFTLIEVLSATLLFFLVLVNVISIYGKMFDIKNDINYKQSMIQ
jgi:type II secretory pathway component PulJ